MTGCRATIAACLLLFAGVDAGNIFGDGFESGDTTAWSSTVP